MSVKLNEKYLGGFVAPTEIEKISHLTKAAYSLVKNKNGAGSDFLGWVDLPVDYDKSSGLAILWSAIWLMWISPSQPGTISANAPKGIRLTILTVATSPTAYF